MSMRSGEESGEDRASARKAPGKDAPALAGGLYFVAVPIGNARDITLRALDVLRTADVIAAEDTRSLRRLMAIHGIAPAGRPILSYHDHNGARVRPRLLEWLRAGRSVACVSEAGSPLVADPGYVLGREALAAGCPVHAVPGPSATLAALTVSGLASDRFLFAGFLPSGRNARRRTLEELGQIPATLIVFESARRIHESLSDMCEILGAGRQTAICRELTKKFEEVLRGSLEELCQTLADRTLRGEIVVVLERSTGERRDGAGGSRDDSEGRAALMEESALMEERLRRALAEMSLRDAVARVAGELGLARRAVYQAALRLEKGE